MRVRLAITAVAGMLALAMSGCDDETICGFAQGSGSGAHLPDFILPDCVEYDGDTGLPTYLQDAFVSELKATPETVASGDTIRFTADASPGSDPLFGGGQIAHYQWDVDGPGGGVIDTGPVPVLEKRVFIRDSGATERREVNVHVISTFGKSASKSIRITITAAGGSSSAPMNQPPKAVITASRTTVPDHGSVQFDGAQSSDPEGQPLDFQWDVDGNGTFEVLTGTTPNTTGYFGGPNIYTVKLRVTDAGGLHDEASVDIEARPPGPGKAVAAAAGGRAFSATFDGSLVPGRHGTISESGGNASLHGLVVRGPFRLSTRQRSLRLLSSARAIGMVDIVRKGPAGTLNMRGVALATSRRGGRACLRIAMASPPNYVQPTGSFRVIGGTGAAERLHASGKFKYSFSSGVSQLTGSARTSTGRPRGLSRACQALARIR